MKKHKSDQNNRNFSAKSNENNVTLRVFCLQHTSVQATNQLQKASYMNASPEIAVIDPNTLCCMGLKTILEKIIPHVTVRCFGSFKELTDDTPDMYVHYFAASQIVLEHTAFFLERRHKTLALTVGNPTGGTLEGTFHTLDIHQPEEKLVRTILKLYHRKDHPHPSTPNEREKEGGRLSPREIEVLVLIVRGLINKEIADRLNISLTTVISHRKNIIEKLGIRSVSGLTIYAVINGYIEANQI